MYHNTFKTAELIFNKLLDHFEVVMKRSEKVPLIEKALKESGYISCKSDGKQISVDIGASVLSMCVYMMALASEISEEIPMKDCELLKLLADVAGILDRGDSKMKKDLPEKLKPIVESWKPGENTILYAELKDGGMTTLVLGSKNSVKTALYELNAKIVEKLDMDFADLIVDMFRFRIRDLIASDTCKEKEYIEHDVSLLNELMGDKDETEENN